jgi:hypothetical protein
MGYLKASSTTMVLLVIYPTSHLYRFLAALETAQIMNELVQ